MPDEAIAVLSVPGVFEPWRANKKWLDFVATRAIMKEADNGVGVAIVWS